jgi:hypothetical protein
MTPFWNGQAFSPASPPNASNGFGQCGFVAGSFAAAIRWGMFNNLNKYWHSILFESLHWGMSCQNEYLP